MKYYAIIDGQQVGPMELEELIHAPLMPHTWVWCKGMSDWQQARDVADICRFWRRRLFDLMHPSPENTSLAPKPQLPTTDEDYKGLSRREFYQSIATHIQQDATDPDRQKLQQGIEPAPLPLWVSILAIVLFFPLGIWAIVSSRRSHTQWQRSQKEESYESARSARMCAGIAICLGIIAISIVLQYLRT